MTILKTYARLFVEDTESALPLYESLVGRPADLRFQFEKADIAAVGDFLIIGGPAVDTAKYRGTLGPVIVDDLDVLVAELVRSGVSTSPSAEGNVLRLINRFVSASAGLSNDAMRLAKLST
ncbi:hypothetical protein ABIE52_000111 [Rhodococcus sp. OAS809]|uniref:VOC family protein n=1 Tax=Rhodococcus sp. OAS809 TaxID=2663874 RepID=UPI0019D87FCB